MQSANLQPNRISVTPTTAMKLQNIRIEKTHHMHEFRIVLESSREPIESWHGLTNHCIGIYQLLKRRDVTLSNLQDASDQYRGCAEEGHELGAADIKAIQFTLT